MDTRKSGFTLIELMITVGIIALLAAIAIPSIIAARVNANVSMAQNRLKSIGTAMEIYAGTQNRYPPNTSSLVNANPQYLTVDYFSGIHAGYTYSTDLLTINNYSISASPMSTNLGNASFTISTGAVLTRN